MSFHLQERRNSWWYNFRWQCFSRYNFFFLFGSGTILSILTAMLKSSHVYSQSKNPFGSHLKLVGELFPTLWFGYYFTETSAHYCWESTTLGAWATVDDVFNSKSSWSEMSCEFRFYLGGEHRCSIAISCFGSNPRLSTSKMRVKSASVTLNIIK